MRFPIDMVWLERICVSTYAETAAGPDMSTGGVNGLDISVWILFIAVLVAGGVVGVFAVLLIGIRTEERRMSLSGVPYNRTQAATRRVLGVGVRRTPHHACCPRLCPCLRCGETPGSYHDARK